MTHAPGQAGRTERGRSLRTQLVAWNILALALLLGVLGGIVRYTVRTTIMASVDGELERQTRPPPRRHPPGAERPREDSPPGPPAPDGPPPEESRPPGRDGPPHRDGGDPNPYRERFFDLRGRPLNPFTPTAAWDPNALARAAQGQPVYSEVTVNAVPLRVLSHTVPPDGPPRGVVQAAYPLTDVRRAMAGVDSALLILIPVALICAGLAGAALTDRVLARVRLMTQAAGRISGQNFAARLPESGSDEFSALAATFNAMLGRQEDAFQQQQRLIEQQRRFTADASHELKTPLTIIKGNTSMALSAPPDPHDNPADLAGDRPRGGHHAASGAGPADAGALGQRAARPGQDRPPGPRDSGTGDGGRHAPGRRSGSIVRGRRNPERLRDGRRDGPPVRQPARQRRAPHPRPTVQITVEACRQGPNAVIAVADTGPGIAPEHLAHLGERFYRVDSSRARPDGGTGLGLSICRGIVEAHGGTLTFESTPGTGTTVRVSLPTACGKQDSEGLTSHKGRKTETPL